MVCEQVDVGDPPPPGGLMTRRDWMGRFESWRGIPDATARIHKGLWALPRLCEVAEEMDPDRDSYGADRRG